MKLKIAIFVIFAVIAVEATILEKIKDLQNLEYFQNSILSPTDHLKYRENTKWNKRSESTRKSKPDVVSNVQSQPYNWPKDNYDNILGDDHVQTPIAIHSSNNKILNDVKPLQYSGYWAQDGNAQIVNDGHTAKVTFENRYVQPHLTGGLLKDRYIFEQMHFHWGETDNIGSEHTIDGKAYSMESHFVHYNSKYSTFSEALKHEDGLVVVAFFIQADGNANNAQFAKISDTIPSIVDPHSKKSIDSDSFFWISKQELDSNYFAYKGSLTTGNYNEVVTWIIYKKPVIVSKQQVAVFREILGDNHKKILNNYRPIQTLKKPSIVIFVDNKLRN